MRCDPRVFVRPKINQVETYLPWLGSFFIVPLYYRHRASYFFSGDRFLRDAILTSHGILFARHFRLVPLSYCTQVLTDPALTITGQYTSWYSRANSSTQNESTTLRCSFVARDSDLCYLIIHLSTVHIFLISWVLVMGTLLCCHHLMALVSFAIRHPRDLFSDIVAWLLLFWTLYPSFSWNFPIFIPCSVDIGLRASHLAPSLRPLYLRQITRLVVISQR